MYKQSYEPIPLNEKNKKLFTIQYLFQRFCFLGQRPGEIAYKYCIELYFSQDKKNLIFFGGGDTLQREK